MKLKIFHETIYQFNSKVFIEPHYLRFKPRITAYNNLEYFNLEVTPQPTGLSELTDIENNLVHFAWFDGMIDKLIVKSESIVNVAEYNPFNFLISPISYADQPFTYSPSLRDLLQPALKVSNLTGSLVEYGNDILSDSKNRTVDFLTNLTKKIHEDFIVESRLMGEPYAASKTFELKKGSCRDLSWMQIQLLRHLGIASRFVSGYFFIDDENMEPELHGWIEVYLPGAGWIGFDPSHGILAGSAHVSVCASTHFENTMPVTGSVRGNATSELITNLSIEVIDEL